MNCRGPLVIFLLITISSNCLSTGSTDSSRIEPKDQVKKVGEDAEFVCKTPEGYADKYPEITFHLHKGGKPWSKADADGTKGNVTLANFKIPNLKKTDAGTYKYKCIIDAKSDNNVSSETNLYVVEADNKTIIVEEGKPITLVCITDSGNLPLAFAWFLNGTQVEKEEKSTYFIKEAEKDLALVPITCKVTAREVNGVYNFSDTYSTEIQKNISVVKVTTCAENPCKMSVEVYGVTPMNITWSLNDVNETMNEAKHMITSTTRYFNYTLPVPLTVSGGGESWSQNITKQEYTTEQPSTDKISAEIIGIICVGVIVIIAIAVIILSCHCYKKRQTTYRGNGNSGGQQSEEMRNVNSGGVALNEDQMGGSNGNGANSGDPNQSVRSQADENVKLLKSKPASIKDEQC